MSGQGPSAPPNVRTETPQEEFLLNELLRQTAILEQFTVRAAQMKSLNEELERLLMVVHVRDAVP